MPKKESVQSDSSQDYDSESSDDNQQPMREVNRANILNYASDSSDDNQESEDFNIPIKKQTKEIAEVSTNNPWGASKRSFYATGKGEQSDDNMSDSDAEEDQ